MLVSIPALSARDVAVVVNDPASFCARNTCDASSASSARLKTKFPVVDAVVVIGVDAHVNPV